VLGYDFKHPTHKIVRDIFFKVISGKLLKPLGELVYDFEHLIHKIVTTLIGGLHKS